MDRRLGNRLDRWLGWILGGVETGVGAAVKAAEVVAGAVPVQLSN